TRSSAARRSTTCNSPAPSNRAQAQVGPKGAPNLASRPLSLPTRQPRRHTAMHDKGSLPPPSPPSPPASVPAGGGEAGAPGSAAPASFRGRGVARALLAPFRFVQRRPGRALVVLVLLALLAAAAYVGGRSLWLDSHLRAARRAVARGHDPVAIR